MPHVRRPHRAIARRRAAVTFGLVTVLGAGCPAQVTTVPGPEAGDLLGRARGLIVLEDPVGGIRAVRLPDLAPATPRERDTDRLPVHSVTGPGGRGRIAFVENDMAGKRHRLVVVQTDGSDERTIFEDRGDALWEHAAGRALALDSRAERVALVARTDGVQLWDPDALLMEGELEVWSVAACARTTSLTRVLDEGLSWFPDGRRLAYTALIERDEARRLLRAEVGPGEDFGASTMDWERVPAVHVLDVETGDARVLHVGERPLVSPDGKLVLLRDFDLGCRLLDLETSTSRPVELPGATFPGAIAFVAANTVLYWAWPTEGGAIGFTEHNSPLVGKKQLRALKLADLTDRRFQTAVPSVDPRFAVGYGDLPGE